MADQFRVVILCEDRRSFTFLRRLCDEHQVRVVGNAAIAPKGVGAASAWVAKQFAYQVRQLRTKKDQKHLGLLVHTDGDDRGVARRIEQLASALEDDKLAPVGETEPIALLVPTWSVETWVLHLAGLARPPETAKLKGGPRAEWSPGLDELEANEGKVIRKAVTAWRALDPAPASLLAARAEAAKVGIR